MTEKALTVIQILPALNGGGVEKGTLEIGRFLTEQGHRSFVVSAGGRMVEQLEMEGSEHIQAEIGAKRLSTFKYIFWFRNLIQQLKPDIIHARSRLPAWVCYLTLKTLPKKSRPKWLTTFHGQHSVNRYSAIMASGEKVITVSDFMKRHIITSYPKVDVNKIIVIHRGVDSKNYFPSFIPDSEWLRLWHKQFPQTKDIPLLTFPGRLTRRKGIEDFIDIMSKLTECGMPVHGLIVGEAHPKQKLYREELEQKIKVRKLSDYISFTGHRNDLREIMAISSIVFNLSKIPEAFGRTTMEALSLGIPVIGYDHGGVAEQLQELYPSGRVPLDDVDYAVKLSQTILNSSKQLIQPNQSYTLKKMCSSTLSVYRDLATNSHYSKKS